MQIRRVVTGHDETGKAIVTFDGAAQNTRKRAFAGTEAALLWVTDEGPAKMDDGVDHADRQIATAPPTGGSILRMVDFMPVTPEMEAISQEQVAKEIGVAAHSTARHPFMHRTKSIDYAIIMTGEIDMLLDDSDVHLKAGDILIQQGTNHAWVNRGREVCRVCFVLIDAEKPAAWGDDAGH